MKELSSLQIERLKYQPKLPASLAGGIPSGKLMWVGMKRDKKYII